MGRGGHSRRSVALALCSNAWPCHQEAVFPARCQLEASASFHVHLDAGRFLDGWYKGLRDA